MQKKKTRKEKTAEQQKAINLEITQDSFTKWYGILLAIMGLAIAIVLIPTFNLDALRNFSTGRIIALVIALILFTWMFVVLPYFTIVTKKKVLIKEERFMLISNRKKHSIDVPIDSLVWWKKVAVSDWGSGIRMQFESKKILLSQIEFSGLFELENYLKSYHKNKMKI